MFQKEEVSILVDMISDRLELIEYYIESKHYNSEVELSKLKQEHSYLESILEKL